MKMIKLVAGQYDSWGPEIDWDHKGKTELSHIYVSHDDCCIRFIQFQYVEDEDNGKLSVLSPMPLRNSYGSRFNVVKLDYPREFIKGISGYWNGNVTSLTFTTNRGTYGPFGHKKQEDDDLAFDFQTGDEPLFGGFLGFFDDRGLTAIGMYVDTELANM